MEDSERNRWPMAKIVAVISDVKGDVCSVRMLVSAADKSENSIRYLRRPVNNCNWIRTHNHLAKWLSVRL